MSEGNDLGNEGSIIRRKAAQRAAGSFAAQLTDSDSDEPVPSGMSDAYPSPKKGKTTITYGGKGRTIATPPKAKRDAARPPTTGARRKSTGNALTVTPPKRQTRPVPARSPSKKRRLSSSPLSSASESEGSRAPSAHPASALDIMRSHTSPLKRASSSTSSLTSLSALSSPSRSTPSKTPTRMQRTSSHPALKSSIFSTRNSPSPSVARTVSSQEDWDLARLGSLVWVRIDKHGDVVTSMEDIVDGDASTITAFWWPGMILNDDVDNIPLRVSLFGKPSTYASDVSEVDNPSHENILSMHTSQHSLRFNSTSFTLPGPPDTYQGSPQKKQKTDLETRWNTAVSRMVARYSEDNDGLMSISSLAAYGTSGASSSAKKRKATRNLSPPTNKNGPTGLDDDESDIEVDRWSPPPPDSLLEIPGELVFARESKKRTEYWPAKVIAYIPPPKQTVKPKYELSYLDATTRQVTRDLFFTFEEPGFLDCKLGQFESTISLEEAHNDDAADHDDDEAVPDAYSDPPTPSLPAPPRTQFCELPIPAQFAYVKPVLSLIISERYEPAKGRHEAFMKGGAARVNVCKSAAAKGDLRAVEVAQLQRCLSRWIQEERSGAEDGTRQPSSDGIEIRGSDETLENERPAVSTDRAVESSEAEAIPSSPVEMPPSSLTVTDNDDLEDDDKLSPLTEGSGSAGNVSAERRDGTPSAERQPEQRHTTKIMPFESLSGVEKVEYCSNVLLPEAIVQLMLWRWEKRTTLEPEDTEEEASLYKLGLEKAEETDWVHDVLRLRQAKFKSTIRRTACRLPPRSNSKGGSGGTRSRPRRVA